MKLTKNEDLQAMGALLTKEASSGQRWACPIGRHFIPEKGIGYVLYEDNANPHRRFIVRIRVIPGWGTSWVVTSASETSGLDTFGCPDALLEKSTMSSPEALDWRRRCHQSNLRRAKKEKKA